MISDRQVPIWENFGPDAGCAAAAGPAPPGVATRVAAAAGVRRHEHGIGIAIPVGTRRAPALVLEKGANPPSTAAVGADESCSAEWKQNWRVFT